MEEHCKSLALQYDLFVNSTLRYLDTATERDYMLKLKVIDQLTYRINQSEADKDIIKRNLEAVQDECSKLTYKLKASARLLDEAQVEKDKLLFEKETMKSQLKQLHSVFKKQDIIEKSHHSLLNQSDCIQLNEKKTFNNTDALLSDLSYSHSEDSSYENVMKNPKHNSAPIKNCSTGNILNNLNTKKCEIMNVNTNNKQIVAITTLTMDLGSVNAKSVIKTYPSPTSQIALISSSSDSIEPMSTSESEKETNISEKENNITEKEHNFIQKIIVIPEFCGHCNKKIKFNNYMVKCLDCKIITHLECKDFIPVICTTDQLKINALNCGVPPSIVHCISEIERRGLETVGLYRVSGSNKEVKSLRDKFRKGLPNLNDIDIHVLCCYLKDLIGNIGMQKYNLISQSDLSKMTDALKNKNNVSKSLCQSVSELPHSNRNILAFLIVHLKKVASSSKCNMDYNCLAIVFGPTIVGVKSTSLDDLHIKSELIFKVIIELLKLPNDFWLSFLKTNSISSDELLHSTPTQSQPRTPGLSNRIFSSGIKRRILDSPKKNKIAKQVEF
ncbi:rac GTPase-activating protein 1-like [Rhopalosiphum padi]|uniref:rac GTPase-activating protein 1-like n=1 Tax=Rhopalosiphum padi TaxID=40932 RepID=UPI00298DD266|nr:rac GTPase-activating protein 1-like [Rhopalosiphum padi]XP_060835118.1 rac GTPase-activating protein 1-like [Rhopalosiphum padi]XP_060835119.1 rac GTPase-activating protein 1-like [Rhopalosiphum padi]